MKLLPKVSVCSLPVYGSCWYWAIGFFPQRVLNIISYSRPGWQMALARLYREGLVVHIASSLGLCLQAALLSIVVSLVIVYLSPLPASGPIALAFSKIRYLPLTGITFYLAILVSDARTMQMSVLFIFMSLYFITSLLAVLKDIPTEEIDHARSSEMQPLGSVLGGGHERKIGLCIWTYCGKTSPSSG